MITWAIKTFDALSAPELYAILQLRSEVFVVEQQCVFQDMDNKDQNSWHVMGWDAGTLAAYTRLVPPGVSFPEPSVGRVVTSPGVRGSGLGRNLMEYSIDQCRKLFGTTTIRIGAQLYLQKFYASLGFVPAGDIYLEDGIQHIEMILS